MEVILCVRQGSTFTFVFRWETTPILYRTISAILAQAPARLTVPSHGIPDGWRAAVVSCDGMTEINAAHTPPWDSEYRQVTVIDLDTVELNDVNAADFSAYTGGGYLQFNTPADLTGYTARMRVKTRPTSLETLLLLTTENGRIAIDNAAKTITLTLSATETAALSVASNVYDLELVSPTGVVTPLAGGPFKVSREITTTT